MVQFFLGNSAQRHNQQDRASASPDDFSFSVVLNETAVLSELPPDSYWTARSLGRNECRDTKRWTPFFRMNLIETFCYGRPPFRRHGALDFQVPSSSCPRSMSRRRLRPTRHHPIPNSKRSLKLTERRVKTLFQTASNFDLTPLPGNLSLVKTS